MHPSLRSGLILILLVYSDGPRQTDIPCSVQFENGEKIYDSCKEIDSSMYCGEEKGYCIKGRRGSSPIGL